MIYKQQDGMTLLELTVVLLILIALAGLAIPYVGGTTGKALCDATDVTMANVKRAIMDRYYLDTLGTFPVSKGDTDYSLKYLFISGGWTDYDPDTGVGWRGPYISNAFNLDGNYVDGDSSNGELGANFKDNANTYIHTSFVANDQVINDAWGRPIIIQVHNSYGARLVSAGPGSGLGIGDADIETKINGNRPSPPNYSDDRILYINAPTPAADVNPRCD